MLCPHINHTNISLHHIDEEYPGKVTFLRGTCPPDTRNGLWSSSVTNVAPDNSGDISKALNKGEDACLPPGNNLQKPAGGKPNWKCQKRGKKIKHEKSIGIRPTACSDLKENEVKLVNFSWSLLLLT